MLLTLLLSSFSAFLAAALIIRFARSREDGYAVTLPQRFHIGHTPRLGGAAMGVACSIGWGWLVSPLSPGNGVGMALPMAVWLWLSVGLSVGTGLYEDLTQRLSVRRRLGFTLVAAGLAVYGLDLQVPGLGIEAWDAGWAARPWLGWGLALLLLTGLPHAFNLIDGYNGLAGSVALIVGAALAYVALAVGDRQLAALSVVLCGATLGFLAWNYPRGLIFAGDGGAYLWGSVIAVLCLRLIQSHPQVSPWFPALLLIYPVWETLFSIYRRLRRGQSAGVADALHFHQLIFRRIVREVYHDDDARRLLIRNNRTSPYLWGYCLLTVVPAVLFWSRTGVLMLLTLCFVGLYVAVYLMMVRFKVPHWLRR